jgi:F-type H+-transporting ATPase subunit c
MTKKLFVLLALLMIASPMIFAQTGATTTAAAEEHAQWVVLSAGFGMAIASAMEGMARNPGAAQAIQLAMLIGLAFIESLALYTLLIIFVKVK